ncbi:MAG TPA: thioredoxin-disulfide reductase [Clostridia bacterium]|nr:thioredoxin-disulfide reductase [Clostridia bacterium]HPQ47209.1 thioredoxin-disulfide reductase [Clostridia bacterium]
MVYDVIIIGGGPAGFTAALYSARANLKTLLLERMFSGGQMATTEVMENYPGFEDPINGIDLAMRMENQAKKFGAEVIYDEVMELELKEKIKTVTTRQTVYKTKSVILAMGGSSRRLGIDQENRLMGRGVSYCATCDGSFYRDMEVAVIGGGDTAVEDANYLSRMCKKVYLVHRRDSLRAVKSLQDEVFRNPKVEIIWDSVVEDIEGKDAVEALKLRNVRTGESSRINIEGVFVAIGINPNTKLVQGVVELSESGHIITDENMNTNIPRVMACGDIREKNLRQVVTAAADGAIAAYSAERQVDSCDC